MTTLKQFVMHVLSKIVIASIILALLLPYFVPTQAAQSFDTSSLVFDSVAGDDYGNTYNVVHAKEGFLWLTGVNGSKKYNGYEFEKIYCGETGGGIPHE